MFLETPRLGSDATGGADAAHRHTSPKTVHFLFSSLILNTVVINYTAEFEMAILPSIQIPRSRVGAHLSGVLEERRY